MSLTPERVVKLINEGYALFDQMTADRHVQGQAEYGAYTFLSPDKNLVEEAMEEVADASNYLRYLFAKLHIMNTVLDETLSDEEVEIGPASIKRDFHD